MSRTPLIRKHKDAVEATPDKVGQAESRSLDGAAPEPLVIEPSDMDFLAKSGKAEALKFNEDVLTVILAPTTDKTSQEVVTVYNNGRPFYFKRGLAMKVKRKFVEILALAKPIDYQISYGIDPATKDSYNTAVPTVGLRYPFTVVDDPAGQKGRVWLEQLLKGA